VFGDNPVEEFALRGEFEDQVYAVALIECVLEAENIRMRDSHQNTNLLLQAINSTPLLSSLGVGGCSTLLKLFDGIASTAALLGAQVDCREMAFSELPLNRVLLTEAVSVAYAGVSENEASHVQDGQFIAIIKITSLVSTHNSIVDVGAVARKILDNSNLVAVLVFTEQQTMAVTDSGCFDDTIWSFAVSLASFLDEESH